DFSASGAGGMQSTTFADVTTVSGGNGLNFHQMQGVLIQNYRMMGNGYATKHYPGDRTGAFPPAASMRATALDIGGQRVSPPAGTPFPSYPVTCQQCAAGGDNQLVISPDLELLQRTPIDPWDWLAPTNYNVFPSAILAMWDSVKDTQAVKVLYPHVYATGGTGVANDPWTGWEAAINGKSYVDIAFTAGFFLVRTPLVFAPCHLTMRGTGYDTTTLYFDPSAANQWMLTFGDTTLLSSPPTSEDGSRTCWGLHLVDLRLGRTSTNPTWVTNGVHVIDMRGSKIEGLRMSEGESFHDTSTHASVAFQWDGRDTSVVTNNWFVGDNPVVYNGSPNGDVSSANRNLDHSDFAANFIICEAGITNPGLTVQAQAFLSDFFIHNVNVARCGHGLSWVASAAYQNSAGVEVDGFRWEQSTASGFAVKMHVVPSAFQSLTIKNVITSNGGISLRGVQGVRITDLHCVLGGYSCLDVAGRQTDPAYSNQDTRVFPVICERCFAVSGMTLDIGPELVVVEHAHRSLHGDSGPFPSTVRFVIDLPNPAKNGAYPPLINNPWTPVLKGDTAAGASTYTTQVGSWYKQGGLVHLSATIKLNVFDSAGTTGTYFITAAANPSYPYMPHTPAAPANVTYACHVGPTGGVNLQSGYTGLHAHMPANSYNILLTSFVTEVPYQFLNIAISPLAFGNGFEITVRCSFPDLGS